MKFTESIDEYGQLDLSFIDDKELRLKEHQNQNLLDRDIEEYSVVLMNIQGINTVKTL